MRAGEPPPLARGRLRHAGRDAPRDRTTPAGAGPTCRCRRRRAARWNHPRWRGADAAVMVDGSGYCEPPPLARGRHGGTMYPRAIAGTTPAGAGPTSSCPTGTARGANHPRWRGADSLRARAESTRFEPPPLARGRHPGHLRLLVRGRTTPAGAGPTSARKAATACATNHPRWRGADLSYSRIGCGVREPPPLARGRRRDRPAAGLRRGTTPAGAGPTLPDLRRYPGCQVISFTWVRTVKAVS